MTGDQAARLLAVFGLLILVYAAWLLIGGC